MALARGLLIATLIFAVVGVILIAIALATDNWKCFTVDNNLLERATAAQRNDANRDEDYDVANDRKYYSRNYGFFRECYPDGDPGAVYRNGVGDQGTLTRVIGTYRSPHGTRCVNSFPGFKKQNGMGLRTKEYVNMKIAYITLYSIGLFIAVLALLFMCIGIGVKKGIPVIFTGFSFLLAAIFLAAAIGVWHKSNDELASISNFSDLDKEHPRYNSQYYRNSYSSNVWDGEGSSTIQDGTVEKFCWSYYIAWIGIALLFLTAIISCCLTMVIAQERKVSRNRKYQDMMGVSGSVMQMGQAYGGGGGGNGGGHGGQIYATGGSEKAIMPSYATGGDSGAYANYGYAGQQQYGQYPQGYNYGNMGDYMGYYNPFATMGR